MSVRSLVERLLNGEPIQDVLDDAVLEEGRLRDVLRRGKARVVRAAQGAKFGWKSHDRYEKDLEIIDTSRAALGKVVSDIENELKKIRKISSDELSNTMKEVTSLITSLNSEKTLKAGLQDFAHTVAVIPSNIMSLNKKIEAARSEMHWIARDIKFPKIYEWELPAKVRRAYVGGMRGLRGLPYDLDVADLSRAVSTLMDLQQEMISLNSRVSRKSGELLRLVTTLNSDSEVRRRLLFIVYTTKPTLTPGKEEEDIRELKKLLVEVLDLVSDVDSDIIATLERLMGEVGKLRQ